MARLFRILGRVAGRAMRSSAFDRALTVGTAYVITEVKLTDLRAQRTLLRRKYNSHLTILGRTVYRLVSNEIDPAGDEHVRQLFGVLSEIEREITAAEEELARRREFDRRKRTTPDPNTVHTGHTSQGTGQGSRTGRRGGTGQGRRGR